MAQERNRVLAGERISRAQLDAAGAPSEADIDAALAACDHERAAMLAIARAKQAPVPVALVARILPGIELAAITCALIAIATGDKTALLDVLERRSFPQATGADNTAAELEAIVLYAAWKAGAPAARIAPELRRLSVRSMTAEGYALLATISDALDLPNVTAVVQPIAGFAKEHAKSVASDERAMTAKLDAVIAALPPDVEISHGGFTVRAQKQVGRNDPCPCGSGLKYKKCHADKDVAMTPSPIAGVSWDDFLGTAANQMTAQHVEELAVRDLIRVDFGRLEVVPLVAAAKRLSRMRAWSHAVRAIDELARRDPAASEGKDETGASWTDDCRDYLIQDLLACGERALFREHVAKLPRELGKLYDLELAVEAGPAEAWQALVRIAREAVASGDKLPDIDLAYTLLRAEPALGIVAARACIGTLHVDDADALLDSVEAARDTLDLPPNDPAWDVLDALTLNKKGKSEDAAELKASLAASAAHADELERTLAALKGELAAERTRPAAELMRAPERASELDSRVHELEALIREGNAERVDLRRQLEKKAKTADSPRRGPAEVEADDGVVDLPVAARGVTLPRFERKFTDALTDVPAAVASEAMRTIGTLSAGDGFAWKGIKQAKDMVRPLLMARVGIHHRLLFRCDDGVLEVVDLITRETLLTTLKRIRAGR